MSIGPVLPKALFQKICRILQHKPLVKLEERRIDSLIAVGHHVLHIESQHKIFRVTAAHTPDIIPRHFPYQIRVSRRSIPRSGDLVC